MFCVRTHTSRSHSATLQTVVASVRVVSDRKRCRRWSTVGSATNYVCQLKNALVREFGESPITIGTVRKLVGEYWNKEYGEVVKSVKKVFWEECQLNGRRPYNPPTAGKMDDVRGTATTIDHY